MAMGRSQLSKINGKDLKTPKTITPQLMHIVHERMKFDENNESLVLSAHIKLLYVDAVRMAFAPKWLHSCPILFQIGKQFLCCCQEKTPLIYKVLVHIGKLALAIFAFCPFYP